MAMPIRFLRHPPREGHPCCDTKLPVFFVDDDTQLYTVSKEPLQLYVDAVTGAVKYTKVGWLPSSAISTGFYDTGNNLVQLVDSSPSYLTWLSTYGITKGGTFSLCPLGSTGQYQVFVSKWNFDQQGVEKRRCKYYALAVLNANPWKLSPYRRSIDFDLVPDHSDMSMAHELMDAEMNIESEMKMEA